MNARESALADAVVHVLNRLRFTIEDDFVSDRDCNASPVDVERRSPEGRPTLQGHVALLDAGRGPHRRRRHQPSMISERKEKLSR